VTAKHSVSPTVAASDANGVWSKQDRSARRRTCGEAAKAHTNRKRRTFLTELAERDRRRIAAYVYGNTLVLAALISLSPEEAANAAKSIAYIVGTAVSTYAAHFLSELVADRAGPEPLKWRPVTPLLRDGSPIAVSALAPAIVLTGGWFNVFPPLAAWLLAGAVPVLRLGLVGLYVSRATRQPPMLRTLAPGILLASAGVCVALAKAALTH
jgi:hypothetical protein